MKNIKKIILTSSVVGVIIATLVSCSKKEDYTCVCTYKGQEVNHYTFNNETKSDAKILCNNKKVIYAGISTDCSLQ